MAINVNLTTLGTLNNTSILQQCNTNFTAIQTALLNALSLNGQAPNQMQSTLDMNSNQIINLAPPISVNSPARLIDVVSNPTIVVRTVGTSGGVVGLLNGNNTYSGTSTFTGAVSFSNTVTSSSTVALTNAVTSNPANTFSVSIGGASVSGNIPNQVTPTSQPVIVAGAYNDSTTTTGGLFQNASWLTQAGSRPSVATFGQAQTTGTAQVWGSNFTGLSSLNGSTAVATELDTAVTVSGGITYNALLVTNNSFANSGAYIQMQSNNNSGRNNNGIVFNLNSANQPITTNLIATSGAISCVNGINFNGATFSGQAIVTPGFAVSSAGNVSTGGIYSTGGAGVSNGEVIFGGSVSGSSVISVNTTGNLILSPGGASPGVLLVAASGGTSGGISLQGSTSGNGNLTVSSTGTQVLCNVALVGQGGLVTNSFYVSPAPVTNTAATFTASIGVPTVIFNTAATCTVTMPSASSSPGNWFYFQTKAAQAINSASSNIVPANSTTAGTAILAATAGKFAALQSDGTNWNIVMSN